MNIFTANCQKGKNIYQEVVDCRELILTRMPWSRSTLQVQHTQSYTFYFADRYVGSQKQAFAIKSKNDKKLARSEKNNYEWK